MRNVILRQGELEQWIDFCYGLLSYDAVVETEELDIIVFQYVHLSTFGSFMQKVHCYVYGTKVI